jgi:hypothetical protein
MVGIWLFMVGFNFGYLVIVGKSFEVIELCFKLHRVVVFSGFETAF